MENEITQEFVSEHLLFPLFRCLSDSYKERYKRDIWNQFENNIRSAAYTSKLRVFYQNIVSSMPIDVQQQYHGKIRIILESYRDKAVLNWLRDECAYMVLVARQKNERRKEAFKEDNLFAEMEQQQEIIESANIDEDLQF
jgi:hypothetical protein